MVKTFNVREYLEKVWCPDESRFMRMDIVEYYRAVFQYIAKREKAVADGEAADAFKPALIAFLDLFTRKIDNHVNDADIDTMFTFPVMKIFQRQGEYENNRFEIPLMNRTIAFLKSHQGYITKNDLKKFKTAFESFMKAMYAQVGDYYHKAGLVRE
jgi:hypothetical protein